MKTEEENKIMDKIIGNSMKNNDFPDISASFTNKLMLKIQQKLSWKQIMSEFLWKSVLVLILLVFAVAILFIPQFSEFLKIVTGITSNWQIILYSSLLVFITIVLDQIVLKYLLSRRKLR